MDGRADIYSIGCVAYWLLTGQFVFTAETSMALLMQHAHKPPTAALGPHRPADPRGTRRPRAGLPGEGSRAATAVGAGAVASAGRGGRRERLDPGAGAGVVGDALGGSPAGAPAGSGAVACRLRGRFARAHAV